jgi:hypothetical protein
MLRVYLVDNDTRLILPASEWGKDVYDALVKMGHTVQSTDQDPDLCARTGPELERRDQLLAETGL